jgi:hypothetical protein
MDQVCEHWLSSPYRRLSTQPTLSLLTQAIDRFDPLKQTESLEPTPLNLNRWSLISLIYRMNSKPKSHQVTARS